MKQRKYKDKEVNGYVIVYEPDHPNAFKSGWHKGFVYEHVLVASLILGRPLKYDEFEQVHHLNFNRKDNRPCNLIVLTKGMHTRLHNWIDRAKLQLHIVENSSEGHHVYKCGHCGEYYLKDKKYCNSECREQHRKSKMPAKDELIEMLKTMNQVEISKIYGVSSSLVYVWKREYQIA